MPFELPHPLSHLMSHPLLVRALIFLSALLMTLLMFVFMASLVNNQFSEPEPQVNAGPLVTTYSPPPVKPIEDKPKPEEMPPVLKVPNTGVTGTFVKGPEVIKPTNLLLNELPQLPPATPRESRGGGDMMAIPMMQIAPEYPIDALQYGKEGFVVLSFDVRADGSVHNIRVEDAEPKRIFDKAAKSALKRWRYQPRVVDGQVVPQPNQFVRLDFKMDQ